MMNLIENTVCSFSDDSTLRPYATFTGIVMKSKLSRRKVEQ